MFEKVSKCALIGAPCPKTNDENAPVYCPHWIVNVPEVEKDGTGRVTAEVFYTGCLLRRQVLYMLSMTAGAGQAAASADKAATEASRCREQVEVMANRPVIQLVEMPIMGELKGSESKGLPPALLDMNLRAGG